MRKNASNRLKKTVKRKINNNKALKSIVSLVLICLVIYEFYVSGGFDELLAPFRGEEAPTTAVTAENDRDELTITMLYVDQGDSMLISYNDHHMLIDTNVTAFYDNVKDALRERGIDSLDYLVATHPHADHIGSMGYLMEDFNVGTYLYTDCTADTVAYEKAMEAAYKYAGSMELMARGDEFTLGGDVKFTVLSPVEGYESDNVNNYSSVLHLQFGEFDALFTGDAESDIETELAEMGLVPDVELLKVGHHGSYTSSHRDFLKAASPEISLISLGIDNEYGFPHQITMDKLAEIDTEVYRTDLLGNITVTADRDGNATVK